MKKMKFVLLPLIALAVASCSGSEREKYIPDDNIVPDPSVTGVLNIRYQKRGFGDKWLTNVIDTFTTKYPNVTVNESPSTEPKVVYGEIIGGVETKYDLYLTEASIMDYRELFVQLNDVYDATVIDEDGLVKDKIEDSYFQSCSDENGNFYTIPGYCGAYGFIYNRDYIEDNEVPVTTDELISLCKSLKALSITPLVYSGGDSSVYLNFLFSSFAAQYEGKEAYLKAQVGRVWDSTQNKYITDVSSAYLTGHSKASEVLETLYWLPNGNSSNQCVGYNANAAQVQLLDTSNNTAMMFNGSWMMTEMSNIVKSKNVDLNSFGMFKAPIISAIKEKCTTIADDAELSNLVKAIDKDATELSGDGYDVDQADFDKVKEARSFVYAGSEGSRFVITKKAEHQDMAKLFLRFYYSNHAVKAFNSALAGCYLPLKASAIDTSNMNRFLKDVYTILAGSYKFFNLPASFMAVTPYLYPEGLTYEKAFGSPNGVDRRTTSQMLEEKKAKWTFDYYKQQMARYGYELDN